MLLKRLLPLFLLAASVIGAWGQIPRSKHVVVLTLENHSYEQVVGNAQMPYFNQLLSEYAVSDQSYATMHNSLSALMWLTAGQTVTLDDNTMDVFNVDNIVRDMQQSGRSWKVYASQLPSVGYLGFNVGEYVKRHNPIAYFSDTQGTLKNNIVPTTPYWQQDIANGTLPEYSYVTPDLIEDAHDGTLAEADAWLKANVPQLLASKQFQEDGILFIVWDEGDVEPVDPRNGGGRIANLVIGPEVKKGFHSQVQYDHQSLLRSTCLALALTGCPGGGAEGVPMIDFFQPNKSATLQVNLVSPAQNNVNGPLHIQAAGLPGPYPTVGMAAYIGNTQVAKSSTPNLNANVNVAPGTYILTVRAWDSSGAYADLTRAINVTAPTLAVSMTSPNTTYVGAPLHIEATGIPGVNPATGMAAYVDNTLVARTSTPSLTADVPLAPGNYEVTVKVWDTKGDVAQSSLQVTIQ